MQHFKPLQPGNFYHVYNHGVAERNLFREPDNYRHFLNLYDKYIIPVADTFAWVLMPNHFHFLLRINIPDRVQNPVGEQDPVRDRQNVNLPSLQFSKLFNSYAQAFNRRFKLRGPLFERPFKRKLIDSEEYLKQVLLYIHNNPVHHGFCTHPVEYLWCSFSDCISKTPTNLKRDKVLSWFDGKANFMTMHNNKIEIEKIEKWLELRIPDRVLLPDRVSNPVGEQDPVRDNLTLQPPHIRNTS